MVFNEDDFLLISGIISFSYAGASPSLMRACGKKGIDLSFSSPTGRFLTRTVGEENGNVLLRREQCRIADDSCRSCMIARSMILGKLYNACWSVERTRRDHATRIDPDRFSEVSETLQGLLPLVSEETSLESLRGLEGTAASAYFGIIEDMILREKETLFNPVAEVLPREAWPIMSGAKWNRAGNTPELRTNRNHEIRYGERAKAFSERFREVNCRINTQKTGRKTNRLCERYNSL